MLPASTRPQVLKFIHQLLAQLPHGLRLVARVIARKDLQLDSGLVHLTFAEVYLQKLLDVIHHWGRPRPSGVSIAPRRSSSEEGGVLLAMPSGGAVKGELQAHLYHAEWKGRRRPILYPVTHVMDLAVG
jgi:hypothetical protein